MWSNQVTCTDWLVVRGGTLLWSREKSEDGGHYEPSQAALEGLEIDIWRSR